MRNIITSKLLFILVLCFMSFTSCKNEKICDVNNLVQRFYSGESITIFEDALNCKVKEEKNSLDKWKIEFPKKDYLLGTRYIKKDSKNPTTYLWFFEDVSNYTKGMIVLMLSRYRKINKNGKIKTITDSYYLIDYKFIPGFTDKITLFDSVSFGKPIVEHGFKRYNKKENIFGIYAFESEYPPYNKVIKPKYLVYVKNDKLMVEESKDDTYFIFRIPEL